MAAFQEGNRHGVEFIHGMTFMQCVALSPKDRSRNFDQTVT